MGEDVFTASPEPLKGENPSNLFTLPKGLDAAGIGCGSWQEVDVNFPSHKICDHFLRQDKLWFMDVRASKFRAIKRDSIFNRNVTTAPPLAYPKCRFFCWCEASCRWQRKALSQTLHVNDSSAKEKEQRRADKKPVERDKTANADQSRGGINRLENWYNMIDGVGIKTESDAGESVEWLYPRA